VTSADDEFDLDSLQSGYATTSSTRRLTTLESKDPSSDRSFSLIAGGNAANFLDGAVIGPAMQLIEGEKLAAVRMLATTKLAGNVVHEVSGHARRLVADIWNRHFL
jgi:adenosylhomocysteinase